MRSGKESRLDFNFPGEEGVVLSRINRGLSVPGAKVGVVQAVSCTGASNSADGL
jgi:hypothetical protein